MKRRRTYQYEYVYRPESITERWQRRLWPWIKLTFWVAFGVAVVLQLAAQHHR